MKKIILISILSLITLIFLGCEEKIIDENITTINSTEDTAFDRKSTTSNNIKDTITNENPTILDDEEKDEDENTNIEKVDKSKDTNMSNNEEDNNQKTIRENNRVIQKGWYIRLTVKSDTLIDNKAVFGYLQGASDGKDRYDSQAYASSGLYVVIYNGNFGNKKEYRSDYRAFKTSGSTKETWIVRVYNRRGTNDDITLSWNGITLVSKRKNSNFEEEHKKNSTELQNMRLVDEDAKNIINVSENKNYNFNMDGKIVREFKWIMLADGDDEPEI